MTHADPPVLSHPALGRMAIELERVLRTTDLPLRQARWAEFERAVLVHMHEEELELIPARSASHRAEMEALLVEHHDIREALVRGRCACTDADPQIALLAVASFRLHQIREESGVHQHLMSAGHAT